MPALLRAGAPVGLGVDGAASNECGELVDEIRAALVLGRAGLAEFTDAEIVELTATIATAIAFSKASVAFGAPDEMPLVVVPTPQIDGDVVR